MVCLLSVVRVTSCLLASFLAVGSATAQEYCYVLDEDPYDLLSDCTSYFEVQNTEADPIEFAGCTAKSYWSIGRHGVHFAEAEDFAVTLADFQEEIVQNHMEGLGMLSR